MKPGDYSYQAHQRAEARREFWYRTAFGLGLVVVVALYLAVTGWWMR